jgi:hypothetical protein
MSSDEVHRPAPNRKPYAAPVVERVILDPIKEMLASCAISGDSKLSGCFEVVNFS